MCLFLFSSFQENVVCAGRLPRTMSYDSARSNSKFGTLEVFKSSPQLGALFGSAV